MSLTTEEALALDDAEFIEWMRWRMRTIARDHRHWVHEKAGAIERLIAIAAKANPPGE